MNAVHNIANFIAWRPFQGGDNLTGFACKRQGHSPDSFCIQDSNPATRLQRSTVTNDTRPRKKSSSAYQRLRRMIEEGQIPIGERLTEADAIQLTGLGRGPVRESLLRLEAEGLLQQRGARRSRCC